MTQRQGPNPFVGNVFADAWREPDGDVSEINGRAFAVLDSAHRQLIEKGGTTSVLVHGSPGTGKTHLLSRLRRSVRSDEGPNGVFIYVRLAANPEALWRHLRSIVVDNLLRRSDGISQLQRLFAHRFAADRSEPPHSWVRAVRVMSQAGEPSLRRYFDESVITAQLPRDLREVVGCLLCGQFVTAARDWLNGEYLSESSLKKLGLKPSAEQIDDESSARRCVLALLKLAPRSFPILLCFDQIEALERFDDDKQAIFTLGKVGAELHDQGENLLLVSCVQSAFLTRLQAHTGGADFDRLREQETSLLALSLPEAMALLKMRLARSEGREGVKHDDEAVRWPFDIRDLEGFCSEERRTARQILAWASKAFGDTPHAASEKSIEASIAPRFDELLASGADALGNVDQHLLHGLPLLCLLESVDLELGPTPNETDVSLGLEHRGRPIHVALLNQSQTQTLYHPLDRLERASDARSEQVETVLLRDERKPIGRGAVKTRERLQRLQKKKIRLVSVSAAALSALAAARHLVSEARAGDLNDGDSAIHSRTVIAWLSRQLKDRMAPTEELLHGIHSGPATPELADDDLRSTVERFRIAPLSEVASELGWTAERTHEASLTDSNIGVLHGPPTVLFARRHAPGAQP